MTVIRVSGVPPDRRNLVGAAILSGGDALGAEFEAWVVAARRPPAFIVHIIGPGGFYRQERFCGRETPAEIAQRIRDTLSGPYATAIRESGGASERTG